MHMVLLYLKSSVLTFNIQNKTGLKAKTMIWANNTLNAAIKSIKSKDSDTQTRFDHEDKKKIDMCLTHIHSDRQCPNSIHSKFLLSRTRSYEQNRNEIQLYCLHP